MRMRMRTTDHSKEIEKFTEEAKRQLKPIIEHEKQTLNYVFYVMFSENAKNGITWTETKKYIEKKITKKYKRRNAWNYFTRVFYRKAYPPRNWQSLHAKRLYQIPSEADPLED